MEAAIRTRDSRIALALFLPLAACPRPTDPVVASRAAPDADAPPPSACADADGPLFPFAVELPEDRPTTECGKAVLPKTRQSWGYITESGCVAIPPSFDLARPFVGDRAVVAVGRLIETEQQWGIVVNYGAIDRSGSLVVPADYLELTDFSGGAATGLISETLPDRAFPSTVGYYIDSDGSRLGEAKCGIQVTPNVHDCDAQSEGLRFTKPSLTRAGWREVLGEEGLQAAIGDLGQLEGMVDSDMVFATSSTPGRYVTLDGKPAFDGWFTEGCAFAEGLACARALDGEGLGYIDRTGAFVIDPVYSSADSFSEGLAIVRREGQRQAIRKDGSVAFTTEERLSGDFHGGLLEFYRNTDGRLTYGFLDGEGKVAMNPSYETVGAPSDGLIAVPAEPLFGEPQWRFIEVSGAEVPGLGELRFGGYTPPAFADGLALVRASTRSEEGTHGEWVDGKYQDLPGSIVSADGYVNRRGEWVVEPAMTWDTVTGILYTGRSFCDEAEGGQ